MDMIVEIQVTKLLT